MEKQTENIDGIVYYHARRSLFARYMGVFLIVMLYFFVLCESFEHSITLFSMSLIPGVLVGWICYKMLTAPKDGLKITDKGISWNNFWGEVYFVSWERIETCEFNDLQGCEDDSSYILIKTFDSEEIEVKVARYNYSQREIIVSINKAYYYFKNKNNLIAADVNNDDDSKFEKGLMEYKQTGTLEKIILLIIVVIILLLFNS